MEHLKEGMKFYGFLAGFVISQIILYLVNGECAVTIVLKALLERM